MTKIKIALITSLVANILFVGLLLTWFFTPLFSYFSFSIHLPRLCQMFQEQIKKEGSQKSDSKLIFQTYCEFDKAGAKYYNKEPLK